MMLLNNNINAFVAVALKGTIHDAQSELNLTQTAITQRIKLLERDLGTTLFLRSRKGMRLTPEGEALLRLCRQVKDLEGQLATDVLKKGASSLVTVTLAGPTSATSARFVDQCARINEKFPRLNLNFLIDDNTNRVDLIRSGRADLAVVAPEEVPNEMDSKVLKPDRYILVATPRWKGRRLTDILATEKMIDFYENDPTTLNYLKHFELLKTSHPPRSFANTNEVLIKLFLNGSGYGTLTEEVALPFLKSGRLISLNSSKAVTSPLALVWYPRNPMPQYFSEIVGAIR